MSLTYRLYQDGDLPALRRLWEENTNWGTVTAEMWRQHVVEAPLGGVSGAVAEDSATGQIVGQFAFMPSLINVSGREYRAFRPAAPIVAKSLRFRSPNPMSHPVVAMYMHAVKALRERGDGLIYMVPDPRWVRFFKMFPNLYGGSFPLWKLDLPLAAKFSLPEGYTAAPLVVLDDERIDQLWAKWSGFHTCQVVRDARSLPWKIGKGEYEVLGVERGGELVGLVASRRKGDRQWLICDLLAADCGEALRATIIAVSNLAHERAASAPPDKTIIKVTLLVTPVMEPVVRDLGFVRDSYDFPMVIHVLNQSITKEEVAPSKWYVSAND